MCEHPKAALPCRRGRTDSAPRSGPVKRRFRPPGWLQTRVANPLDRIAFALRIPPPGDALLETIGRTTGRPHVTPVCDGMLGDTFWVVAQHGRDSDYVRNIAADPRVRVKGSLVRTGWRAGMAHILDDDDPAERVRFLGSDNRWRRLCLRTSQLNATHPLTVPVDLDHR